MRIRVLLATGFLLVCTAVVLYRVWNLQVNQSSWLRELSQGQYLKEITLEPMRGPIEDRQGAPMAVSVMTESVFAMPGQLTDPRLAGKKLAQVLGLDPKRLVRKLSSRKHFTWVKRRLSTELAQQVRDLSLPGVHFTAESRRFYPSRDLASSVIGFAGDGRGLEGVELMFDGELRGSTVLAQGLRDARGQLLFSEGVELPALVRGGGLVLTLDRTIQEIAETVLEETVSSTGAKAATAIVLEPHSGEILAMANVPTFNPNTFWKFTAARFRNRAVTDCYEPGSTLKIFTMAAALSAGVLQPEDRIDCQRGSFVIGAHTIHDSHRGGFEELTPAEILMNSSNIGIAKIGARLGKQALYQGLRQFGFGRKTGIDLPGESRCRLRKAERWSDVGLATISFGQGISITPLQLTVAMGSIANGGVWMRPLVIKEIRGPANELVERFEPEPAGRVVSPAVARLLTHMMVKVTEPGGTGTGAAIAGLKVAGKTGTAQKVDSITGGYSKDRRVASFVGFVPADRPRVVVLVVVDEPTSSPYGGVVAAPAFARIADGALRYLGVFAEEELPRAEAMVPAPVQNVPPKQEESVLAELSGQANPSPRIVLALERLPDLRGLSVRQALGRLAPAGLEVVVSGSGRVKSQQPPPGSPVARTTLVKLGLEKSPNAAGTEIAVVSNRKKKR